MKNNSSIYQFLEEKINPVEAAFFMDNSADFEELIGLIFYWGYRGYIEIEEVDSPIQDIDKKYDAYVHNHDYIIFKKSEIPVDAEIYEKELFNLIFPDGNNHRNIRDLKKEKTEIKNWKH